MIFILWTHVDQPEGTPGVGSFESLSQSIDGKSEENSTYGDWHCTSGCPGVVQSSLGHGNFRELPRAHGKQYSNLCVINSQTHLGAPVKQESLIFSLAATCFTQEGSGTIPPPGEGSKHGESREQKNYHSPPQHSHTQTSTGKPAKLSVGGHGTLN